jgi:predicted Zn-dependent peptidase
LFFLLLTTLFSSDPYRNITHYTLNNGLEVYLYPDNKAKNTAINVDVKVGMKAENEKNAGISHLLEHLVFRDTRVEYRDYLDFFKKEGAHYVNAHTRYYKTRYVTTINSDKSYWIVEQFAQMLLDKNVTKEDLEVERGALQVEIGAYTWADKYLPTLKKGIDFIKDLFPPKPNFYKDEFGIDIKDEEIKHIPISIYRANNQKFTLKEVLDHYKIYYYPSNMILSVVGNFDLLKMKETIEKSFGKYRYSTGKSVEKKIYKIAKLNKKPYRKFAIGAKRNKVIIGTKLIASDPKKVIILKSYVEDLAQRLNRVFRNKNGESYGAFGHYSQYHDGAIATISFDAKHSSLDKNIGYAQSQIKKESNGKLTDKKIQNALKSSEKEYNSLEHDYKTLMDIIFQYQNFQKIFPDLNKTTPYEIFKTITIDEFRTTVEQTFIPNNSYKYIVRDYRFFPHEVTIIFLILALIMIYIVNKLFGQGSYSRIMFYRRLTNRFIVFIVILSSLIITAIITEWVFYFVTQSLPINTTLWHSNYDAPVSYLIYFIDFIIFVVILYFVVKLLYKWFYTKLFISEHHLILSGVKSKYINVLDIQKISVEKWKPSLFGKVYGLSPLFWKPLLKIVSRYSDVIYLRTNNAEHLKSDLEFAIYDKDRRVKKR